MTVYIRQADVPKFDDDLGSFMRRFSVQVEPVRTEQDNDLVPCELVGPASAGFDLRGEGWELGGFAGKIYDKNEKLYEAEELTKLLLLEEAGELYEKMDKAGMLDEFKEQSVVSSIAFVVMAETGAIDDITATEHISSFAEWTADIAYLAGQIRRYDAKLYRCIQPHTS